MKHLSKLLSLSLIVFVASFFIATPVRAIPPLPSSFYGTVKVNNANVPDGTVIQALIGGQVYAEGYTQTYQGDSVYTLDVRGDDSGTTTVDGGREGDTIQFKIGGAPAVQTAVWKTATNVALNLTAVPSVPLLPPQATPTPVPTQTAIAIAIEPPPIPVTSTPIEPPIAPTALGQSSSTPASQPVQSSATPASQAQTSESSQSSQSATQSVRLSPIPATEEQSVPLSEISEPSDKNDPNNYLGIVVFIVTIVVIVTGFIIRTLRKRL